LQHAARQDVVTKSCRVNTAVTRLLNGRRSLAHWLSDCRRLLCNRAGSVARLNQSDIVFIFSIRLLAHLGEARPAIFTIEHCEECQHDRTPSFDHAVILVVAHFRLSSSLA
jgi:hypothetical protein